MTRIVLSVNADESEFDSAATAMLAGYPSGAVEALSITRDVRTANGTVEYQGTTYATLGPQVPVVHGTFVVVVRGEGESL